MSELNMKFRWEYIRYHALNDKARCVDKAEMVVGTVERQAYGDTAGEWRAVCELRRDGTGTSIGNFTTEEAAKSAVEAEVKLLREKPKSRRGGIAK